MLHPSGTIRGWLARRRVLNWIRDYAESLPAVTYGERELRFQVYDAIYRIESTVSPGAWHDLRNRTPEEWLALALRRFWDPQKDLSPVYERFGLELARMGYAREVTEWLERVSPIDPRLPALRAQAIAESNKRENPALLAWARSILEEAHAETER